MFYGIRSEYREYRLRKVGVEADAIVTAIHLRGRRASGSIDCEFTYAGRTIKGSDFVSIASQQKYPVGTAVRIRLLPNAPDFNHISTKNGFLRIQWLLGIVAISAFPILSTIGLLQLWITKWKKLRNAVAA